MHQVDSHPGLYRGVCVDATDTQGLGRIKVIVPQVTGPNAIVTAWPCTPLAVQVATAVTTSVTPSSGTATASSSATSTVTTVPVTAKQGVWIMYESGHPDKPVWIGVF